MKNRLISWIAVILALSFAFTSCTSAPQNPTITENSQSPASQPTQAVVRVLALPTQQPAVPSTPPPTSEPTQTVMPSPTALVTQPVETATAVVTATQATPAASALGACTNQALLDKHVSIPPNTYLKPGLGFGKIWRLKNTGTCTWTTEYSLVFTGGDQLEAPASVLLPNEVKPAETVDVKVVFFTPLDGDLRLYTNSWMLEDPAGDQFGIGVDASQPITSSVTTIPTSGMGYSCH